MNDTELLDWISDELVDLRCISLPNADAGDCSEHWEVVQHYMGKPEKVIGCGSTPRKAIFDATLEPGDVRRSDYVPPDAGRCKACAPETGFQCGLYDGHEGGHTAMIPTHAPWIKKPANA